MTILASRPKEEAYFPIDLWVCVAVSPGGLMEHNSGPKETAATAPLDPGNAAVFVYDKLMNTAGTR